MKRIDFDNGNFVQSAAYRGPHALVSATPRRETLRLIPT